ncbi:hypothetical protein GCM10010170_042060 [Dactylosporangium salmoneum]|uniref:Helix-turn-helix domain-containing protein n=1 Tax=Dactylosporangium salmoneum TaxID=53361 RepID=A0ABN3GHH1_9ACTN
MVKRYVDDRLPIRAVAAELGLSYGKVHALLVESATPRRPVGGRRTRSQPAPDAASSAQPTATRPTVSAAAGPAGAVRGVSAC